MKELPDVYQKLYVQQLLNDFTLFPSLPLELRRKIWRFTFPGPRKMDIDIYTAN
ncbi:hypothetical protein B0J14DRAFT_604158 [Halenospora varia]|nr:hypothetical protein B0J14DRAFT_604158 [Halenospora varia]